MHRKVKFEPGLDKPSANKPTNSQQRGREGGSMRAVPTRLKDDQQNGGQRQKNPPMGFEEFLHRKPTKPNSRQEPLKGSANRQRPKLEKQTSQSVDKRRQKPKEGILRERSPMAKPLEDPLAEPEDRSLENIFASRMDNSFTDKAELPKQIVFAQESPPSLPQVNTKSAPPHKSDEPISPVLQNNSSVGTPGQPGIGGQKPVVRGMFKKELYGEDDLKKKELQQKVKKELEEQMEQNKAKKEFEKRRKDEEEKREQERYQKYVERESQKREEELRKEDDLKRKKDLFSQQQAALLEEYHQQTTMEKKSRASKKPQNDVMPAISKNILDSKTEDYGSNHGGRGIMSTQDKNYGSINADRQSMQSHLMNQNTTASHGLNAPGSLENFRITNFANEGLHRVLPHQAVSPPSMPLDSMNGPSPFSQNALDYQASPSPQMFQAQQGYPARQFTPLTVLSNNGIKELNLDSIPVEKNILENLLKENHGLKQEANRNNIILDFLTNVIVKKQQAAGNHSLPPGFIADTSFPAGNLIGPGPGFVNPRLREEPRTAETIYHTSNRVPDPDLMPSRGHPSTNQSKKKPFRINTPVNQPVVHPKTSQPHSRQDILYRADAQRKLKSSSPSNVKQQIINHRNNHKASTMMDEFQDIDNFKMLAGDAEYEHQHLNFEDQPYDEGIEFRDRDYRQNYREPNQSPVLLGNGTTNGISGNYKSIEEMDSNNESNIFPPGRTKLNSVNRNDIKSRSEKYKHELASKLSKIRSELNGKDTKIDSLLNRIAGNY